MSLNDLLLRGAEVAAPDGAPLGVLALEVVRDGGPAVSVEGFFAHQGLLRQLQRLDVRIHAAMTSKPEADLVSAALGGFAGTAFTNIVLARADGHELCDLTVSVAPRLPVWVSNTLLAGDGLSPDEVLHCSEVFQQLGIPNRSSAGALHVAAHQLRRQPTSGQQIQAFSAACDRFEHVELFASPLPPLQSARLAFQKTTSGGEIDVTLTRSDLEHSSVARKTADQMQALLRERFGFGFDGTRWRGRNFHAERMPFESRGVIPERGLRSWSLNWNARSR